MKIFVKILVSMIALLGVFSCHKGENTPDLPALYQQIKSCNKLVFDSMDITKTVTIKDDKWYTVGDRVAVYSYDSYLRAFEDLSALTADDIVFDNSARTVTLTLPPMQWEMAGRDMNLNLDYENIGLVRSNMTSEERATAKERANSSLMEELKTDPTYKSKLISTAEAKARLYFEALLAQTGYTPIVKFKKSAE